jgi:hypothetical protein
VERRFFAFCALAIVPCGIASGAAARAANDGWDELAHESAAHVARLALGTLDQDLGAAVDSLLGAGDLLPNPDTTIEAVRRAMAGDTVSALDPTVSGVELMVLFPDDEGQLGFANGMLVPGAAVLVGRVARARVGLYLHGELWSATDPPPSVAVIDRETLLAASRTPGGARIETASVVAMDPHSGPPSRHRGTRPTGGAWPVNRSAGVPTRNRLATDLFDRGRLDPIQEGKGSRQPTGNESLSTGATGMRSPLHSLGHAHAQCNAPSMRRLVRVSRLTWPKPCP